MSSWLGIFKLEKLTIRGYKDAKYSSSAGEPFEAMFNPSGYTQSLISKWQCRQPPGSSAAKLQYVCGKPNELKFTLLLDDTGVDEMGVLAFFRPDLETRLEAFTKLCYRYQGGIHQPNFLLVEWGNLSFPCRLARADIKYTLFDRDGLPLRAEITTVFLHDVDPVTRSKLEAKQSPDLTHARIVRKGDTLPLLTKEIYGSPACYLDVARYNNLDDFRNLIPGQQLLFPPIVTFKTGAQSAAGK